MARPKRRKERSWDDDWETVQGFLANTSGILETAFARFARTALPYWMRRAQELEQELLRLRRRLTVAKVGTATTGTAGNGTARDSTSAAPSGSANNGGQTCT